MAIHSEICLFRSPGLPCFKGLLNHSHAVQELIIVLICTDTLEVKVPILLGQRSPTPPPVSSLLSLCFLRRWAILYRIRFVGTGGKKKAHMLIHLVFLDFELILTAIRDQILSLIVEGGSSQALAPLSEG